MNLLYWFSGGGFSNGMPVDMAWPWVSLTLGALVALGYCVIAMNWYFQEKLRRRIESRRSLGRLCGICISCAICGGVFYLTDMPFLVWRIYDCILLLLVVRTWSFV